MQFVSLLTRYCHLSVHPSVYFGTHDRCRKLYHLIPSRELSIQFWCKMYRLATEERECQQTVKKLTGNTAVR